MPAATAIGRGRLLAAVLLAASAGLLAAVLVIDLLVGDEDPRPDVVLDNSPVELPTNAEDPSGEQAPDVDFELLDGGRGSIADYRGRPVVVNFFAKWCAPCVQEMPDLEEVHAELGEEVAFLGLSENETAEDARDIVEQTGVSYTIGRDPDGSVLAAFEGVAMPTTVLISADGTITSLHSGPLERDELLDRVREELL